MIAGSAYRIPSRSASKRISHNPQRILLTPLQTCRMLFVGSFAAARTPGDRFQFDLILPGKIKSIRLNLTRQINRTRFDKSNKGRAMTIVSMMVGNCHVGESYLSVIRKITNKVKGGWSNVDRETRVEVIREIIRSHNRNRQLFLDVHYGTLGPRPVKPISVGARTKRHGS